MAIHNLATVFGPNLLGPPGNEYLCNVLTIEDKSTITLVQDTPQINGIVSVLIEDYDVIFTVLFFILLCNLLEQRHRRNSCSSL